MQFKMDQWSKVEETLKKEARCMHAAASLRRGKLSSASVVSFCSLKPTDKEKPRVVVVCFAQQWQATSLALAKELERIRKAGAFGKL